MGVAVVVGCLTVCGDAGQLTSFYWTRSLSPSLNHKQQQCTTHSDLAMTSIFFFFFCCLMLFVSLCWKFFMRVVISWLFPCQRNVKRLFFVMRCFFAFFSRSRVLFFVLETIFLDLPAMMCEREIFRSFEKNSTIILCAATLSSWQNLSTFYREIDRGGV